MRSRTSPPYTQRPTIVWLGRAGSRTWRECRQLCESTGLVLDASSLHTALASPPELCVVALDRPEDYDALALDSLRQRFPHTRVVTLLGAWCEGETRTGRPIPGAWRVYAHEAVAWLQHELHSLAPGYVAVDSLSLAKLNEARWLSTPCGSSDEPPLRIAVCSPSARWLETLCEQLTAEGHMIVGFMPDQMPWMLEIDALVWDIPTPLGAHRTLPIPHQLAERAPIIALSDFVREHELEHWRQLGASHVLGKPVRIETLLATLHSVSEPRSLRRAA